MVPWILLDTAAVPGGGELRLKRRGAEFSIMLGSNELMNSRLSGSEEALAKLACERLGERAAPTILIGGLGMGFTLRAALAEVPPQATVVVAEIVPAVIRWARGRMADMFGGSLDDPRVSVHEGDVGELIGAGPAAYDAILLDVDNGPEGLSRPDNDSLYDTAGLGLARRALRPGGVLGVWSSSRSSAFTQRLRKVGFNVEEVTARAHARRGAKHTVWLAVR
jgi:spermidine synthase